MLDSYVDRKDAGYVACIENHEDGSLRVHIYLVLSEHITTVNPTMFDVGGNHPNIRIVGEEREDQIKVVQYIVKEDQVWALWKRVPFFDRFFSPLLQERFV